MGHPDRPNYGSSPAAVVDPYTAEQRAALQADAEQILARYPQKRSALLPLLHLVQSVDGYISTRGIEFCAETVEVSAAEVSGVATFYTQYKRFPNGRYTVGVCTNTLCAVMGGDAIWDAVSAHLGIGHDETTDDGMITLERVECNAACDYAPVVMANWEFFDNQTPQKVIELVDALRAGQAVAPTRGAAQVVTFTEMSRVLAGFPDGRAGEGVGAGPASTIGLQAARIQDVSGAASGAAPTTPDPQDRVPPQPPAASPGGEHSSVDTPTNQPDHKPTADGARPAGETPPADAEGKGDA